MFGSDASADIKSKYTRKMPAKPAGVPNARGGWKLRENNFLLTGGGCLGRVALFGEYTFIPRKHIPVRKYEGGYIAGPI